MLEAINLKYITGKSILITCLQRNGLIENSIMTVYLQPVTQSLCKLHYVSC